MFVEVSKMHYKESLCVMTSANAFSHLKLGLGGSCLDTLYD